MDVGLPTTPLQTTQLNSQATWHEIIWKVSDAGLFADSKHFVDCPVLRPWELVAADWEQLKVDGVTQEALKCFIASNFGPPGSDLEAVLPASWHEEPPAWLAGLPEEEARAFGAAVHQLWKTLCRKVSSDVLANPDRHTLLPLPQPFIVPGDRFRECYNWDSYWVILGLLASGLLPAARQLLTNLLGLVDVWGFVPNGARAYYTNRSQPPLLSAMVAAVAAATATAQEESRGREETLLREALPRLIAHHGYWTSGPKLEGGGTGERTVFELSRYHAELYEPRPESFREDLNLVEGAGLGPEAARALYCDIASAAESGWDFSTRWFVGGDSLAHTRTTQIVPADLNAWLYRTELDIAHMAARLGDSATRDAFAARAAERAAAMDLLMWSDADGCWHDLLLQPSPAPPAGVYPTQQRAGVYASNWVPLWCGVAAPGSSRAVAAAAGLRSSGLLQPGGLLTSLCRSGQQWDAPNSWPPLVHMAVEGLERSGAPGAAEAAAGLARSYVAGCRAAWGATGHMHEKYDAMGTCNARRKVNCERTIGRVCHASAATHLCQLWHEKYDAMVPGGVGRGGEYVPQVGFGWSNGVLMTLLRKYGA
eukprot:XP_001693125.1 trehalase-like protein [Chlamydomonas reinhardtii]